MKISEILSENIRQRPGFAIFLAFLFYLLGAYLLTPLMGLAGREFLGLDASSGEALFRGDFSTHPNGRLFFLLLQSFHQIISYGISAWLIMNLAECSLADRGLDRRGPFLLLGLAGLVMSGAIIWGQQLNFDPERSYLPEAFEEFESSLQQMEIQSRDLLLSLLQVDNPMYLIGVLVVMALIPAICEELFFRSFMQQQLMRMMQPLVAIAVGAFVFSFLHFQFHGFFGRLVLGFLLGWMFWKSGNLYTSMVGHFVFNGVSILGGYLSLKANNWEWDGTSMEAMPWYYVLLALLLTFISLYFFQLIAGRSYEDEKEE